VQVRPNQGAPPAPSAPPTHTNTPSTRHLRHTFRRPPGAPGGAGAAPHAGAAGERFERGHGRGRGGPAARPPRGAGLCAHALCARREARGRRGDASAARAVSGMPGPVAFSWCTRVVGQCMSLVCLCAHALGLSRSWLTPGHASAARALPGKPGLGVLVCAPVCQRVRLVCQETCEGRASVKSDALVLNLFCSLFWSLLPYGPWGAGYSEMAVFALGCLQLATLIPDSRRHVIHARLANEVRDGGAARMPPAELHG